MKTPLTLLREKLQNKLSVAETMNTPHWVGVKSGLKDSIDELDLLIENEKKQFLSAYADGIGDAAEILEDDNESPISIENADYAGKWFNKKYPD